MKDRAEKSKKNHISHLTASKTIPGSCNDDVVVKLHKKLIHLSTDQQKRHTMLIHTSPAVL